MVLRRPISGSSVRPRDGGEVVIEASGDLAVGPPLLDGSGQVGVEAFGLLTVGDEGLRAWDADESQKAAVVIEARGVLTVHPGVVTPPAGVVLADLRRVSPTMPTPTLDANGRPT